MRIPEKYFWPGLIVSILGMSVLVQAYLVYRATSDNGPQVLDDYYTKETQYDETVAAKQASSRLGWSAEVTLLDANEPSRRHVQVIISDMDGTPLSGLTGSVELRSPALAAPLGTAKFTELGPGLYRATVKGTNVERAGLFDTTVKLARPQMTAMFLHEKRHEAL